MREKLKSRKFLTTVAGIITVIANDLFDLGLDGDTILALVTLVAGYVLGEGYVDGKKVEKDA
jgi:hypothetical protein